MASADMKHLEKWVSVVAVVAVVLLFFAPGDHLAKLTLAIGYGALLLVFLFGAMVLTNMAIGKIDLSELLEEESGGASMSRFQLLIFTFVISLSFFLLVAKSDKFPEVPTEVLTLLGISGTTYAVGKGIQASSEKDEEDDEDDGNVNPPAGAGGPGAGGPPIPRPPR